MIKKLIFLAVIIMVLMTFRMENDFDMNSGRLRVHWSLLGFTLVDQVKETPLSQLKQQFFPGETEAKWVRIGGKTEENQANQSIPVDALLKVATALNGDQISETQKKAIMEKVWGNLKSQNYEAIRQVQAQLEQPTKAQ
jgi:hypothetical protein